MRDLPLVSPLGAIAGKRRWDQKGALRIANHTSIRFGHDSYLNDRKLKSCEPSKPTSIPEAGRTFHRPASHIFPGLKQAIEDEYAFQKDKKSLYKDIITAKRRPKDLIAVLKKEKKYRVKEEYGRCEASLNAGFAHTLGAAKSM